MSAPQANEIVDDSSDNSFVVAVTNNDLDSGIPIEEDDVERGRLYRVLLSISSLAVPLLIVTFLLFPAVLVVLILLAVCIIPAIVVLCLGTILYLCAPETSSTFALLWGTNGGENHATRRWDMDWSLLNYVESAAGGGAPEPKSRDDLEKLLILKTVVADASGDEKEKELQQENRATKDAQLQDKGEDRDEGKEEDEKPISSDVKSHAQGENSDSSGHDDSEKPNQLHVESCTTNLEEEEVNSNVQDIETWKIPDSSKIDSHPYYTIRLSDIEQSCCDICMMDYELGDVVSQSHNENCDHIFHKDCILDWMQKKHSCPCCRRNYLGEDDHDGLPNPVLPRWTENL